MKLASGADIQSIPLEEAVTHWYRSRRRRLARLYQPSKRKAIQIEPGLQHGLAFDEDEECDYEEELAQCEDDGVCDLAECIYG
jgi:hypothetical protein